MLTLEHAALSELPPEFVKYFPAEQLEQAAAFTLVEYLPEEHYSKPSREYQHVISAGTT